MTTSPLLVLERTVAVHRALTAAAIPHAVGGALALAYHVAEPRGTRDIDVNVTTDDAEAALRALPDDVPWTAQDLAAIRRDGQVRLRWPVAGEPTHPLPLDLFFPQHRFHTVAAGRCELVPMLDAQVPILAATDLAVFKALFDRPKDWVDIEEMVRHGGVDLEEVQVWLDEIVGPGDDRTDRLAVAVAAARSPAKTVVTTADLFRRNRL